MAYKLFIKVCTHTGMTGAYIFLLFIYYISFPWKVHPKANIIQEWEYKHSKLHCNKQSVRRRARETDLNNINRKPHKLTCSRTKKIF